MSPVSVPQLVHRSPEELGIRRVRRGRGFSYHRADGTRIVDDATLARIRGLAIPPAWVDVHVSEVADSHLQAVGRDARGRRQYRYHADWTAFRDRVKFDRLTVVASSLPAIRRQIDHDVALPGLPRDKVLATVVALLETTLIRVGNDEYARDNGSYGLTTLRNRHAHVHGSEVTFVFTGKGGQHHRVRAHDRRVARVLRRCQEIPGQRLFQYVDEDGSPAAIHSHNVNDYLRDSAGADITAKDFRTWIATVIAAGALGRLDPPESDTEAHRELQRVIDDVAKRLGNTPAVCRSAYIHPDVPTTYRTGVLADQWAATPPRRARLTLDERRTRALLTSKRRRRRAEVVTSVA